MQYLKVFVSIVLFATLMACGPSAEERRQQEIADSLQLEQDRVDLLERANRLLESAGGTADAKKDDKDTL